VRTVEEGADGLIVVTNDDAREPLDPTTLAVGRDNVMYCRVKGGEFLARFLRPAYYHLSPYFRPDDNGGFSLVIDGRHHPIKTQA
jgi:hypothetical protein